MISMCLDKSQLATLRTALRSLALPPAKRKTLLARIVRRGIIPAAKRHQRQQVTPDGKSWAPRARGKGKMLKGLPKLLKNKQIDGGDGQKIYFYSEKTGASMSAGGLAKVHSEGHSFSMTADRFKHQGGNENRPPTKKQVARLRSLKLSRTDKGKKIPVSSAWMMEHMTFSQAGLLIRKLENRAPVKTWEVNIPARPFLGVSDDEFNKILARELQSINYGVPVKPSDIGGKQ
ncbi:TPA: hypothetical protein QIF36_004160 [Enterobacter kobei]|nr:hypothetical protein [Enterobacter kobei]